MIKVDSESWAIRARWVLLAKVFMSASKLLIQRAVAKMFPNGRVGWSFTREKKPAVPYSAVGFDELDFEFHLPLTS
jgi:hypothetical protein